MVWDTRRRIAGGNGRRALNYAAISNDCDMIEALLEAGADIDGTNRSGFTPLHHAAESGSLEAAKLLIVKGAKLDQRNRRGSEAMEIAKARGHTQVAELIEDAQQVTVGE